MALYRLFRLDEQGRFERFVEFEAADDEEAATVATRLPLAPGELGRGMQFLAGLSRQTAPR